MVLFVYIYTVRLNAQFRFFQRFCFFFVFFLWFTSFIVTAIRLQCGQYTALKSPTCTEEDATSYAACCVYKAKYRCCPKLARVYQFLSWSDLKKSDSWCLDFNKKKKKIRNGSQMGKKVRFGPLMFTR